MFLKNLKNYDNGIILYRYFDKGIISSCYKELIDSLTKCLALHHLLFIV